MSDDPVWMRCRSRAIAAWRAYSLAGLRAAYQGEAVFRQLVEPGAGGGTAQFRHHGGG